MRGSLGAQHSLRPLEGDRIVLDCLSPLALLRADFWEGDEHGNFSYFSESGGSVNGPNLFTKLPFL